MKSVRGKESDRSAVDNPPAEVDRTHGQGGREKHQTGDANKNTRDQQVNDPQGGGGGSKGGGGDKK